MIVSTVMEWTMFMIEQSYFIHTKESENGKWKLFTQAIAKTWKRPVCSYHGNVGIDGILFHWPHVFLFV